MTTAEKGWGRFAVQATVIGAVVFVAVRAASARPGTAGGPTRTALTIAGTLTGVTLPTMATFTFRRAGSSTPLCSPQVMVPTSPFTAEVPLDQAGQVCPDNLFDGSDVVVDVAVAGTSVVTGGVINPVPYARYAEHYGTPDCPVGYERDATALRTVLCKRALIGGAFDEVVRVGMGATAFWIDRYEATVWQNVDGSGRQWFRTNNDFDPSTFPISGRASVPLFALSRSGYLPAQSVTWFQSNEACAASGKRLPTGTEWLRGARGTPDPIVPNDGLLGGNTACNTLHTTAPFVRSTGLGTGCESDWGSQDMIGNMGEYTDEWFVGPDPVSSASGDWGDPNFYSDLTAGIGTSAVNMRTAVVRGLPAIGFRGGYYLSGTGAGIFNMAPDGSPASWSEGAGFRCMIPR